MTELKPCPFCGGKPFISKGYESYWITCQECGAEGNAHTSDNEAIEAWNTRAERTCHLETNCHTCSRCSECGYHVWHVYNYCPSCGAKVVEECTS